MAYPEKISFPDKEQRRPLVDPDGQVSAAEINKFRDKLNANALFHDVHDDLAALQLKFPNPPKGAFAYLLDGSCYRCVNVGWTTDPTIPGNGGAATYFKGYYIESNGQTALEKLKVAYPEGAPGWRAVLRVIGGVDQEAIWDEDAGDWFQFTLQNILQSYAIEVNTADSKATPAASDVFNFLDSAANFIVKKFTWSNLIATLKTYFDTIYAPIGSEGNTYTPPIDYATVQEMLDDQVDQQVGYEYTVEDASGWSTIEHNGWAKFEKKATSTASESDYIPRAQQDFDSVPITDVKDSNGDSLVDENGNVNGVAKDEDVLHKTGDETKSGKLKLLDSLEMNGNAFSGPQSPFWSGSANQWANFGYSSGFLYISTLVKGENASWKSTHPSLPGSAIVGSTQGFRIYMFSTPSSIGEEVSVISSFIIETVSGSQSKADSAEQNAINNTAQNYVPKEGSTQINGTKTFSESPIVPNASLNTHAINKAQAIDLTKPIQNTDTPYADLQALYDDQANQQKGYGYKVTGIESAFWYLGTANAGSQDYDHVGASNDIWGEKPTGTIDGVNKIFTVSQAYVATKLRVFRNGIRQTITDDYTETSSTTFEFLVAPVVDGEGAEKILIDYTPQ